MPRTTNATPPPVWLLVAATMTGPLALNIFVPSMPGLPEAFDTVPATVQLTLSLYLVGVAVGQLLYGPLSDRFGRRPVLLGGLTVFVVASLACAVAPSIGALIAGRVAQALGGCAGMVIARAIVRDVWNREDATAVLAMVIAGMAVAPMVGPAVGGFMDVWVGWRSNFVLLVAFGLIVWIAGVMALPETNTRRTPMPGLPALLVAYRSLLAKPVFLGHALIAGFNTAAFFAFLAGAPYAMVERMGRPPSEYGLFFVLLALGYIGGNMTVSRVASRFSAESLALTGIICGLIGPVVVLAFLASGVMTPFVLFLPTILLCFGNGLAMPASMTAAISVDLSLAGTASGLLGFMQMGLGAVASTAVAAIHAGEPLVMVAGMILMNVLAVGALVLARRGRAQ